jgi:uncharacterized membrane protein
LSWKTGGVWLESAGALSLMMIIMLILRLILLILIIINMRPVIRRPQTTTVASITRGAWRRLNLGFDVAVEARARPSRPPRNNY